MKLRDFAALKYLLVKNKHYLEDEEQYKRIYAYVDNCFMDTYLIDLRIENEGSPLQERTV